MTEEHAESASLAKQQRDPFKTDAMGVLRPNTLGEAKEICNLLAGSDFVPKDYQGKPGNVFAAIQLGASVGLSPMQALQAIAVINGRPALWGDGALAVVRAHRAFDSIEEFTEGDTAICKIRRRERAADGTVRVRETIGSFSVEQAKKAKLWGKSGPWSEYPDRMLKMRARGFAMRDAFGDALKGLSIGEDVIDIPGEAVEVAIVPAQAPPPSKGVNAVTERLKGKGKQAKPAQGIPDAAKPWIADLNKAEVVDDVMGIARDFDDLSGELAADVRDVVASAIDAAIERLGG